MQTRFMRNIGRKDKHPEEKDKHKKIAKKFFTAGFNTGVFEARKEENGN